MDDFFISASQMIDKRLDELTSAHASLPYFPLFTAARYSLLSSGKRLRPLLLLATLQLYDIPLELGLDPACALEMIHTYSLIHDDLPCMDNDDFRRGKPTLHRAFSESEAVLAGDFLLTYAFEVLCQSQNLSADQKVALIQTFSGHAGAHGMIGGQVIDLQSESTPITSEILYAMHEGKTAKLMMAALEAGAIIAGAPASDKSLLSLIGKKIGLAFQIADDLTDQDAKKATAISILGYEASHSLASTLREEALTALTELSRPATLLKALLQRIAVTN